MENRAVDEEIEGFGNAGKIDVEEFGFAKGRKGVEKFCFICEAFSRCPDVTTITFQKGTKDDGLTFDETTKETFLFEEDNLEFICRNSQIDRAYFLFRMSFGGDFLLIVEKSRCDSVFYFDTREVTNEEARRIVRIIEEDAFIAQRRKFRLIRHNVKY